MRPLDDRQKARFVISLALSAIVGLLAAALNITHWWELAIIIAALVFVLAPWVLLPRDP